MRRYSLLQKPDGLPGTAAPDTSENRNVPTRPAPTRMEIGRVCEKIPPEYIHIALADKTDCSVGTVFIVNEDHQ